MGKPAGPVEGIGVYFNLPHRPALPVLGSEHDANDFTPLPPADCPRLR